ncbi:MAG: lysophospholipid acyltransferase family protein [Candidatus Acidiferrales bacterium]
MKAARQWVEYAALWALLKGCGVLPRGAARRFGAGAAALLFALRPGLRRVAEMNLKIAFPEWDESKRRQVIRGMVRQLGWMAGEFSQFPKYSAEKIRDIVQIEGLENFLAAERRGKGVLFLTGHIGAWEMAPFAQARYGHPLYFLARAVENPRVDTLVNSYRTMCGNRAIEKNRSARDVLRALGEGGTVGILADQNTLPEEGTFVDFFGLAACTTTGIARMALHTDAAVVPGYILWDAEMGKYRLRLEPAVELVRSVDSESDVRGNTARFTKVIERVVRENPEQWVWVHKRWKTRPAGEKGIY